MPIDITKNYIRIRQKDPSDFIKGSFRTIVLSDGIKAIIGKIKKDGPTIIQSLLFDKKKFNIRTAKAWIKTHLKKYSEEKILRVKAKMDLLKMLNRLADVHFAKTGRWTRKYINDLPDSAFAIILPGGKKDEEGKTVPRSLRKLPYKDHTGKVDIPHLRNALARVNQPKTGLTPEQRKKAKALLEKVAKKYLKTYIEEGKKSKMSSDEFEDVAITNFEEEDIFSKIKSVIERLEAAETLDDAKAIIPELKQLVEDDSEVDEDGEENETKEGEEKEEEKKGEKEEGQEEKEEMKDSQNSTEEDTKLSEVLDLNDKILSALKESENEIERLKKELTDKEVKFKEQVELLNNINKKYKEDFSEFVEQVKDFLSVFEAERIQRFNKKVDEVLDAYVKFTNVTDEKEKARIKEMISKWSEDMLEQTMKAISMKRSKMSAKEPVALTAPSSKLKGVTKFSLKEWNNMSPEEKTSYLHKKLVELTKKS